MMDKTAIKDVFVAHSRNVGGIGINRIHRISEQMLITAADEIAQAHKQDMAAETERAEKEGRCWGCDVVGAMAMARRENDALRAKVAGLVGLLIEFAAKPELEGRDGWQDDEFGIHCAHCDAATESFLEDIEHDDDCPILRARAALKDTPQVLWSGKGKADISTDMTDVTNVTDWPMTWVHGEDFQLAVRKRIEVGPWMPLPIDVELFMCLPLGNQSGKNALQPESKAQEPDSEQEEATDE